MTTALLCAYAVGWLFLIWYYVPSPIASRSIQSSAVMAALIATWPLSLPAIAVARAIARR